MNKFFNRIIALFALSATALPFTANAAADDEEPIVTIRTNAVKEGAAGFGITLGTATTTEDFEIDFGFGRDLVEVEPWSITDGEINGTYIACSPVEVVKIYGDASKLNMLRVAGAYVTGIELDKCTNLELLDLTHNQLQSLDLTPLTNLYALYLSDNPFTAATPAIIGAPKPALHILEVDNVGYLSPTFNLSDYPELVAFDGYHNFSIFECDPSGCPKLESLSLEMTNVSTLDVSKNLKLNSLNIAETRISDLDISKNEYLVRLTAGHYSGSINVGYHLNGIDLTHNPYLMVVDLAGNQLSSVDVSKNPLLQTLFLTNNNLTSLDLSANTNMASLMLNHNDMDFATLPLPKETWTEYWYEQRPLQIGRRSIAVGSEIDLSARVLREGTVTTAKVFRQLYDGEPVEIDAEAYTYADGKIRFNQVLTDSVYVQYHNSVLNEYDLVTPPFVVKSEADLNKPSKIVSFTIDGTLTSAMNVSVGMDGASATTPKTFYVDLGDGNLQACTATSQSISATPNLNKTVTGANSIIDIYIPEGEVMTALSIDGMPLRTINLACATELRELSLTGCSLTGINLAYNRCLQSLCLKGNKLTDVDLSGIYGNYEKNVLNTIDASDNLLTRFYILSRGSIRNLDLSNNKLTEYDLKDLDNIDVLDLSHNDIAGDINIAYQSEASSIDLSHNHITGLLFDGFNRLSHFDVSNNDLTLQTLPLMPEVADYVYAPMNPFVLLENAPAVNLSDLNRVVDGRGTTFVWKKAGSGTPLVEGVDMTCTDGATRFLDTNLGKVYCEMTNPAFPQFTGNNVYTTTEVNVVGAPTNFVASFTTLNDATDGEVIFTGARKTALYIDWRGDGTEFLPYPVETSYKSYPGQRTFAGANVKVYTYEQASDITVFSLYGMPLADFDATALTNLTALSVCGAKLPADKMKLPDANLSELKLEGNALTEYPFAEKYPNLWMLGLSNNNLTEFDASKLQSLSGLYLAHNALTSVKFNNPNLWELALDFNELENVDLTGLPALEQASIQSNQLSSIDLTPVARSIRALSISTNKFTFATLPVQSKYPNLSVYFYGNQAPVEPVISNNNMTFDLSSQADVNGTPTTYTWYLGEIEYDSASGEISGEALYVDEEYTLENGVTTFLTDFNDKVMCVMTNPLFPATFMYTPLYKVGNSSGIENVLAGTDSNAPVDVYNIQGMLVRKQVNPAEALQNLPRGIYIVSGRKVLVK